MRIVKVILFFVLIQFTSNAQILTFDFAGLAGSELTATSNFNNAGINASVISRGIGLTAAANADRYNATNWALTSIANAVAGNNFMQFTITPVAGNQFSVSSIVISMQRSASGPSGIALRSSADGYTTDLGGAQAIADVTTTQTFTFTFAQSNACNTAITYRIYMFAEATAGSGGPGDFAGNDITVNGTVTACLPENCSDGIDNDGDGFIDGADPDCSSNTITTGAVAGSPFLIDCSTFSSITVPFTSSGTFNAPNVFTVQLSDNTGSFSFPITIGSISMSGLNPSGSIPATILAGLTSGASYRIRVISSDPAVVGSDNGVNLTITNSGSPCYGPLIVNEVSQGPSGSKEYMEFLVIGNNPCGTIDIRNLIFDDNNGDFSGGPVAGTGIANGHIRFTNHAQWANVPNGSLIVVYNEGDINANIPADDPSDLLVPDRVYVLPSSSPFLEGCSSIPTVGNAAYTPCVYGAGSFAYISMANTADAAQTRFANGTYNHGVSWGGAPMNGGPDGLNIGTTSSSGQLIEFENTVDDDYTNAANFTRSTSPADETPGAPNSAANATFINTFVCTTLPVEYISFNASRIGSDVLLNWETASESNSDYFIVERAGSDFVFESIGNVKAAGNSSIIQSYSFTDRNLTAGIYYYRLKQTDRDGEYNYSIVRVIKWQDDLFEPVLSNGRIDLSGCTENVLVQVYDVSGKLVATPEIANGEFRINTLNKGLYVMQILCNSSVYAFKLSLQGE